MQKSHVLAQALCKYPFKESQKKKNVKVCFVIDSPFWHKCSSSVVAIPLVDLIILFCQRDLLLLFYYLIVIILLSYYYHYVIIISLFVC